MNDEQVIADVIVKAVRVATADLKAEVAALKADVAASKAEGAVMAKRLDAVETRNAGLAKQVEGLQRELADATVLTRYLPAARAPARSA